MDRCITADGKSVTEHIAGQELLVLPVLNGNFAVYKDYRDQGNPLGNGNDRLPAINVSRMRVMKRGKHAAVFAYIASTWHQQKFLAPASIRAGSSATTRPGRGFSLVELMVTVSLLGTLVMLAVPSYSDAMNKRRISQAAEQIVSFLNLTQSEAMKRSKPMVISYTKTESGSWCLGARLGTAACDCMEAAPDSNLYCAVESSPWLLGDGDVALENIIQYATGDGSFVIDPVRGLVQDSDEGFADTFQLGLQADEQKFRVSISIVKTGKVSACTPQEAEPIGGFKSCPQDS